MRESVSSKIKPVTPLFPLVYNYKYNGKEWQDELGLNMYDYGARNYDPAIGRWMNMDPMAEKYYQISPYVYVANNPLLYIDPTGMTIEDPDKLVEKQKANLKNSISTLQGFIKSGGMSEELGNKLIGFFNDNLTEISVMEKSDQVYNVYKDNSTSGSGVSYDKATDKVMIGIDKDDYGIVGHELKHGYQFEKGKISLITDNSGYGSLYDVGDETESYNRERQFKSGRDYFENPSAFVWQNSDVLNFGKSMTPSAYQNLPLGPININSKEGKALRNRTIEAGKNGQTVKEVYKGWKKNYEKGAKTTR
ncbi:RHS repeat-associated core domain-containing protein [Flavobacterium branchiophilum]|uniref:RHS repeat-associated core domain-containing protein n=1 Tax=Flavobacterium branchiophilum TaxID=55197 RepID=UPI0039EE2577